MQKSTCMVISSERKNFSVSTSPEKMGDFFLLVLN